MSVDMQTMDARASRGAQPVVVAFVSVAIAFVVVVLRIFTRISIVRNIGPEDYVIVASLIISITLSALICIEYQHGQGHHIATIPKDDSRILFMALWASIPIYSLALTLTKVSILLQYWRVFVGRTIRRVVLALFVATCVYGLWSILGTIFMCTPVAYFWDQDIPGGHCLNKHAVWFANASLNIITDIAIFILPMPVLHDLHLPNRQRIALMAVFGLGGFVCLTSILRLKALYTISVSKDATWDNGGAAAWSSLEVNVGIICASLPTLRKAITRFFPRVFSSSAAAAAVAAAGTGSRSRRFPVAQEAAEWANVLHTPGAYGKSSAHIGLDSRIETGSLGKDGYFSDEDVERGHSGGGGDGLGGVKDGRIKVMTVTTQEVEIASAASSASSSSSSANSPALVELATFERSDSYDLPSAK